MKNIARAINFLCVISIAGLLYSFAFPPKSIYDIQLKDIDNRSVDLSMHKGKKIVIITLSGKESDSTLLQLSSFYSKYKDSAVIIGVLSLEDGFKEANKAEVKKRYTEEKELDIILTEGVYTRKAAARNQCHLMYWLTHKEENMHFDGDVRGSGHKFFVDETGVLYGSIGPQAPLTHPFIAKIMSKQKRSMTPVSVPGGK